jgi:hypothetical protein
LRSIALSFVNARDEPAELDASKGVQAEQPIGIGDDCFWSRQDSDRLRWHGVVMGIMHGVGHADKPLQEASSPTSQSHGTSLAG